MLAEKDKYIHKAYDKLEEISADEEKRLEYEARQKAIRDHRHMLASGRREGIREGRKEGIKEGLKEGRKEGIREGIKEGMHDKAMEMARKMLADKFLLEKVVEYTGLTLEEVQELSRSEVTKQ